jgi:hypothetical protein
MKTFGKIWIQNIRFFFRGHHYRDVIYGYPIDKNLKYWGNLKKWRKPSRDDWQAYFHRSLGINRSHGINWSEDMNLLEGINESLGTNQNPADSELNCLKYFFSRITSLVFLGRVWNLISFSDLFDLSPFRSTPIGLRMLTGWTKKSVNIWPLFHCNMGQILTLFFGPPGISDLKKPIPSKKYRGFLNIFKI